MKEGRKEFERDLENNFHILTKLLKHKKIISIVKMKGPLESYLFCLIEDH